MNCDKESNFTHSKSRVQWWSIFAIFGIVIAFTACDKDNDNVPVDEYPSLKVVNQNNDNRSITSIKLVGY